MSRPTRNEEVTTERRRRRSDALAGRAKKLHVDEDDLELDKYAYRFVNDTGNRIHQLTKQDDWDVVDAKDYRHAGVDENGKPVRAVLVRKPIEYNDEDQAAKQRRIDEQEKAISRGAGENGDMAENSYAPDGKALSIG